MAAAAARLSAALLWALALALAGCVQDDGSRFNPLEDFTTVSEREERELGLEFDEQVRKKVVVIEDPVVAGFIHDLGQQIVRTLEPQPFIYRFRIIADPSLNAFAVPGGYVYFHSGTVLAASSIHELAGVMGHEIAHVKARHYARMREKTQIPDLLSGVAGMAAAVATGEPGLLVATQAANVAVKLRFSREFENEADRLGGVFMTRAGYSPAGITRFFERILDEQKQHPHDLPPYLFTHPDVEDRIDAVRIQAEGLRPAAAAPASLDEALVDAQARLAYLVETGRTRVPPLAEPADTAATDPLLADAERARAAGRPDEALLLLARAEALEPRDPRVPFQIGDLLAAQGRHRDAIDAYRRAIRLDPTRALPFYREGLSHEELGERHAAVHAFEQASRRAGGSSDLRRRADWQIETLIFPVLLESGLADGSAGGDTPFGRRLERYPAGARSLAWWARLDSRYAAYPPQMSVHWKAPDGVTVAQTPVQRRARPWVGALLELPAEATPGEWTLEARFEDELLERRRFLVQSVR